MADRSLARGSSRRMTTQSAAQPQSPPRKTTRVTRSQSRDISDNDAEKDVTRQIRRKPKKTSPMDNKETTRPSRQAKDRSKPSNPARPLQDLPEVDESPKITYPQLPQDDSAQGGAAERDSDAAHRQSGHTVKSTGGLSGFSGTTIRTSQSDHELSMASAEDMADTLMDLSDASDKLLQLLLPEDFSEASVQNHQTRLSNSQSRERKRLGRYSSSFQAHHSVYGDARFIDVPSLTRTALHMRQNEDIQPGPCRMDPVLYKANLTAMIMATMTQDNDSVEQSLKALDKDFPRPFLQEFVPKTSVEETADGSALFMDTFVLALEIRTRFFIESVKHFVDAPNFDPNSILQQLFYKNGNIPNGWEVNGMRSEDLIKRPELRKIVIRRLDELRQTFSEETPYIDLDSLDREFPPNRLLASLSHWTHFRVQEIAAQLGRLQGASGIARALQDILASCSDGDQLLHGTGPANKALLPRRSYGFNSPKVLPSAVARLKTREAERRVSKKQEQLLQKPTDAVSSLLTASSAAFTATPTRSGTQTKVPASAPARVQQQGEIRSISQAPPPWQPPPIEDEISPPTDNGPDHALVETVLSTQDKLNAESNKENVVIEPRARTVLNTQLDRRTAAPTRKFIDAQSGAERISWDSQESEAMPASNSGRIVRDQATQSQSDVSEDEGFQQDRREIIQRKRQDVAGRDEARQPVRRSSAKRGRSATGGRELDGADDLGDVVANHNNAGEPPAPTPLEMYREVNSTAKLRVALQPKKTQTRTPWSGEETDRLQELIEEYGLSWSVLKNCDAADQEPLLKNRDQVALKDKARNMKFDYLKSGPNLPKNFSGIPINASMIERLANMGIRYDRETGRRTDNRQSPDH